MRMTVSARRLREAALVLGVAALVTATGLLLWQMWPTAPLPVPLTPPVTLLPAPTSTPGLAATPTTGADAAATALPGQATIGAYVQISGTGGDGLRLRAAPGLDGTPLFLGFDGEIYEVRQGPAIADGYTWWFLVSPYDENRSGWAAARYLEVITP